MTITDVVAQIAGDTRPRTTTCIEGTFACPSGTLLTVSDARPETDEQYLLACAIVMHREPTFTEFCDTVDQALAFFSLIDLDPASDAWAIERVRHYAELFEDPLHVTVTAGTRQRVFKMERNV